MAAPVPSTRSKPSPTRGPTERELFWETAMREWVPQVTLLLAAGLLGFAYWQGWVAERTMGLLLVGALVVVPLGLGARMYFPRVQATRARRLGWAALGVWAVAVVGPTVAALFPGEVVAEAALEKAAVDRPAVARFEKLPEGSHRYLLDVEGHLAPGESQRDVDAPFDVIVGEGPAATTVHGTLSRHWVERRSGRRGTAAGWVAHDRTHFTETVELVGPGPVPVTATAIAPELGGKLAARLRPAPVSPLVWLVFALCAVGAAAWADHRLRHVRGGTQLAPIVGASVMFAQLLVHYASPDEVVRPVAGSAFLGGVAGTIGGAMLVWMLKRAVPGPGHHDAAV